MHFISYSENNHKNINYRHQFFKYLFDAISGELAVSTPE